MKYVITCLVFLFLMTGFSDAQSPADTGLRIADTLSVKERSSGQRVILKQELDSLIREYNLIRLETPVKEAVQPVKDQMSTGYFILLASGVFLTTLLVFLLLYRQKRSYRMMHDLARNIKHSSGPVLPAKTKASQNLEKKIGDMHSELEKLQARNQQLEQPAREYRLIKHEYESMKLQIAEVYKMKNYPGYDPNRPGSEMLKGLFETEKAVANYAYEKFLKPILAIADTHKNNPAKIDKQESERLLQLLVSLSLLYIEYLYLRIGDLSIGGKMVKRIQGLKNGNGLDPELMKELNTEHGSRALVLRMVLNAVSVHKLAYPVFDETNLNLS
jgi:hypothetical protein